jgi:hypothetical protein
MEDLNVLFDFTVVTGMPRRQKWLKIDVKISPPAKVLGTV